jgi:CBS domain containing-hemolysin-like protein
MTTIHWILLSLGLGCVGLSFFLSGLEAGLVEVSRLRLRRMAREGDIGASRLLRYLDQPEDTLWTILVGNTVANVILGLVGLYGLQQLFGVRETSQLLELTQTAGFFWAVFLAGCLFFYAFCELLSKTLFRKYATRLSISLSRIFGWIDLLFSPLVELLKSLSELVLFSAEGTGRGNLFSSREELRQLMTASGQGLTDDERVMIDRVLDLQKIPVRELAVSFDELPEISTEDPVSHLISNQAIGAYTRLPVWDLQQGKRRIAGVLNLRRLIFLPESEWKRPAGHFVESALYQDEDVRLQKLLQTMQRSGQRVVVILDKQKRELGMVSLPDILKVVFGEVRV